MHSRRPKSKHKTSDVITVNKTFKSGLQKKCKKKKRNSGFWNGLSAQWLQITISSGAVDLSVFTLTKAREWTALICRVCVCVSHAQSYLTLASPPAPYGYIADIICMDTQAKCGGDNLASRESYNWGQTRSNCAEQFFASGILLFFILNNSLSLANFLWRALPLLVTE